VRSIGENKKQIRRQSNALPSTQLWRIVAFVIKRKPLPLRIIGKIRSYSYFAIVVISPLTKKNVLLIAPHKFIAHLPERLVKATRRICVYIVYKKNFLLIAPHKFIAHLPERLVKATCDYYICVNLLHTF
jgi:hypothetical protein